MLDPDQRRLASTERAFDRRYGVMTCGLLHASNVGAISSNADHAVFYMPTEAWIIPTLFTHISDIKHEDFVFVDLGSGMGRMLLAASDYPFKRVIGVEFSHQLHAIAEQNLRSYRSAVQRCHAIGSVCMDVTEFRFPDEPLVVYMFNPFRRHVMERVISNLDRSLSAQERPAYILYVNPRERDVLDRATRFEVSRTVPDPNPKKGDDDLSCLIYAAKY